MTFALLLAATLAAAPVDATITTLDGQTLTGPLLKLDQNQLELGGDSPTQLALNRLMSVQLAGEPIEAEQPSIWLKFADDSQSTATSFQLADGQARWTLVDGTKLTCPIGQVVSARFYAESPALADQWKNIVDRNRAGDVVIVRKSAEAIDMLEGIVSSISDREVQFEYNGQKIPVQRTKLEGIAFVSSTQDLPPTLCRVTDRLGNTWQATRLTIDAEGLELTACMGASWRWTTDKVSQLDFSSGNVLYLSDLKAESLSWTPYLDTPIAAEALAKMFSPRADRSFDGGKLQLGAPDGKPQEFAKGLALHSRSEMVFRLPDEFRRLQALVGIDHRVCPRGHVVLTISGDDKELLKREVSGQDNPFELDLQVTGVRRLKVVVDYGQNLDVADHLNMCDARLVK